MTGSRLIICFFSQVALVAKAEGTDAVVPVNEKVAPVKLVVKEHKFYFVTEPETMKRVEKICKNAGKALVGIELMRHAEGIIKWSGRVAYALIHNNVRALDW